LSLGATNPITLRSLETALAGVVADRKGDKPWRGTFRAPDESDVRPRGISAGVRVSASRGRANYDAMSSAVATSLVISAGILSVSVVSMRAMEPSER
jgi:hypothetical protein